MNLPFTTHLRRSFIVLGAATLVACGGGGGGGGGSTTTKTTLTLASAPAGLALMLDGQAAPSTFEANQGSEHTLSAATQNANGRRWVFSNWSDGGAATHTITTPSAATTYTATFTDGGPSSGTAPSVVILSGNTNGRVGVANVYIVTALDPDNDLAKVELLDGGVVLGEDTASPYSFTWTPGTAGTHELRARAIDAQGLSTLSGVVSVTVAP